MTDLDQTIRDTLSAEERQFLERLDEPSLPTMLTDTYRGTMRIPLIASTIVTAAFFGLSVYSAYRLFLAEGVRDLMIWQSALLFSLAAVGMNKLMLWMEIQRKSLLREIKRLELQVARSRIGS